MSDDIGNRKVQERKIDWDALVRRVAGPEPPRRLAYEFSDGKKKYQDNDHYPPASP